eukprot:3409172-Pleurochrysis_carterae.AAC.1
MPVEVRKQRACPLKSASSEPRRAPFATCATPQIEFWYPMDLRVSGKVGASESLAAIPAHTDGLAFTRTSAKLTWNDEALFLGSRTEPPDDVAVQPRCRVGRPARDVAPWLLLQRACAGALAVPIVSFR